MTNEKEITYGVRFSEPALINLILNSLEAYSVVHKNKPKGKKIRTRLETFGHLFGHIVEVDEDHKIFHVDFVNTDTSSKQDTDSVSYNEKSAILKRDAIRSFWPSYQYLGDYHTHPYEHFTEVEEIKGFHLSPRDRKEFSSNNSFWKNVGHRLSLLVSIGYMDRAGTKDPQFIGKGHNCIEFTLGNYRLWLSAYYSYLKKGKLVYSEDESEQIYIDCPSLVGFFWDHAPFGRVRVTQRKTEYNGKD
ncbi:hypothetical protein [Maridesulfovibrio sp.]|uniref:hypothetical protein n=1 Tax=unclassified Maridesulfovibrio TaxID=2794999 RepID=UPI003B00EC74